MSSYKHKYHKYKNKYLDLLKSSGGAECNACNRALVEEIKQTIKDNDVVVYVKTGCPWCKKAIDLLEQHYKGKKDVKIVTVTPTIHEALKICIDDTNGQTTVPYVFINQEFIGGYDKLAQKFEQ